jgi:hypothetical protein
MGPFEGQRSKDLREGMVEMEEGDFPRRKSPRRQEIEELLEKKGLVLEPGITALNLDTGEAHRFDDYYGLQEFLKGREGRWYITTPGIRKS